MRTATLRTTALLAVMGALGVLPLRAQTSANGTATIVIPQVLRISVSNTNVSFNTPTSTDFTTGHIDASSPASVISHGGNVVHSVRISADAANFTPTTDPLHVKPAGDFLWSMDGGGSWNSISTTAADVRTSVARGMYLSGATVQYRMSLDFDDEPDTYTLNFTYTVVAG